MESAIPPTPPKGAMDNKKVLELALESLERQRLQIEADIEALRAGLRGRSKVDKAESTPPARRRRRGRSAAQRRALSLRMKAYWAERRAQSKEVKRLGAGSRKRRPKTAAEKKALSIKMKEAWARRKAAANKGR